MGWGGGGRRVAPVGRRKAQQRIRDAHSSYQEAVPPSKVPASKVPQGQTAHQKSRGRMRVGGRPPPLQVSLLLNRLPEPFSALRLRVSVARMDPISAHGRIPPPHTHMPHSCICSIPAFVLSLHLLYTPGLVPAFVPHLSAEAFAFSRVFFTSLVFRSHEQSSPSSSGSSHASAS